MSNQNIYVLLVVEQEETAQLAKENLLKFEEARFVLTWVTSAEVALTTLHDRTDIDIIVTDYYLTGMNGVEFTRVILKENKTEIPVVFLSSNKDMYVVIEVMKLGVKDYLFKENISNPIFPRTLLALVEKVRIKRAVGELEVKRRRLDAMQEIVMQISNEISEPLEQMKSIVTELIGHGPNEKAMKYLKLIKENVERMELKMVKLQNLKDDKTVQYIKDIRMLDLS